MRARWALVPCFFVGGILVACSLSLDGYSNGSATSDDGGSGPPKLDDGGTAPAVDSATTDGGAEAAPGLCAQANLFCTTFDDNSLSAVSTKTTKTAGAVVEVTDGSAHCSVPAFNGGANLNATFEHSVSTTGVRFAADVDLFVKTPAWGNQKGNGNVFEFGVDGDNHQGFELYVSGPVSSVTTTYQDAQYAFDALQKIIPYDRWFHLHIDADFTPRDGSYTLTIDGNTVATRQGIAFSDEPSPARIAARVGVVAVNAPTPSLDARTDNLLITAR